MKRATIILCALLCMASRHPDRMVRGDLVLNASFNRGDASDRSMYEHTPTLANGAVVTAGNRYLTLDGVNDYLSYPDHDSFSGTAGGGVDRAFSVSCWVQLTSATDAYRTAVSKLTTTGNQFEWQLFASTDSTFFKGVSFACYHADGSASIQRSQVTKSITAGAWFHIVAVYDGSESASGISLFVNGVSVAGATNYGSGTYTGMTNGTAQLRVGLHTSTSNPLAGDVDDVWIYSRALSANDAMTIYSEGHP